jgi:hypothetical protein
MVSTLKKSQARTPKAWARRKSRHDCAARRVDARPVQDQPDRAGRHLVAQPDQLTLDPTMPPGRVLSRQTQDQLADFASGRRASRTPTRVGPLVGD